MHFKQQVRICKGGPESQTKFSSSTHSCESHKGEKHKDRQKSYKNTHSNAVDATKEIKGLTKNKYGVFASPAVRHTL